MLRHLPRPRAVASAASELIYSVEAQKAQKCAFAHVLPPRQRSRLPPPSVPTPSPAGCLRAAYLSPTGYKAPRLTLVSIMDSSAEAYVGGGSYRCSGSFCAPYGVVALRLELAPAPPTSVSQICLVSPRHWSEAQPTCSGSCLCGTMQADTFPGLARWSPGIFAVASARRPPQVPRDGTSLGAEAAGPNSCRLRRPPSPTAQRSPES